MTKILLVEDDEISALVLATVLSDEGYEVIKATSFEEALTAGVSASPHLLITDWRLDGVHTGNEVAVYLAEENKLLQVIFISGIEAHEIKQATQNSKVLAILGKPCDYDEVLAIVKKNFPL